MVHQTAGAACAFVALFSLTTLCASAAMPAMNAAPIDCSTAPARMAGLMSMPPAALATAKTQDTDRAFAAIMKMATEHAAMVVQIEMKCGKDSRAMDAAKKMEQQLDYDAALDQALNNEFTSP